MKTKTKLLFAKIIYFFLSALKFSTNVKVRRNNINWNLDLSEGIDLSIYLFGKFDPLIIDMAKALNLRKKINIIDIGIKITNLFFIYIPDIRAIDKIGVKFGICAINLEAIPKRTNRTHNI